MKIVTALCALFLCLIPSLSFAQEVFDEYVEGEVTQIIETTYPIVFGQEIEFQNLEVKLQHGNLIQNVFNDYTPVSPGTTVFLSLGFDPETEQEGYFVREIDRTNILFMID